MNQNYQQCGTTLPFCPMIISEKRTKCLTFLIYTHVIYTKHTLISTDTGTVCALFEAF